MTIAENPFAFSVDAPSVGSAAVVRLTGELDMASAPELEAGLLALADGDVIVDLAGLTFMDSSGIRVLIVAFKRAAAHGRNFVLRAPPAQVARVLQLSGTDQVFTIEPPDGPSTP